MVAVILAFLYMVANAYFSYKAIGDGEGPTRIGMLLFFGVFIKLYEKIAKRG